MNVVVAHPSPEVRRELRTPLEAFGYGVIEVANPNEALERCRAVRPEVVLVHEDVAMESGAHSLVQEQLHRGAQDVLLEPVMPVEVLLTGLFNRRYVLARLASLISGARRHGRPLSISMIDVDHFKRVNDAHGHEVGDKALVEVAFSLRERLRAEDELGRLGGEEFLALLPDAGEQAAATESDKIQRNVDDLRVLAGGESELGLTISVGWATWDGEESPEMLIRRADLALYEAKDAGRNRVRGSQNLSARLRRRI